MVFSLEHDIKVTKNHQNLLPTQSVLVAHTVDKQHSHCFGIMGSHGNFAFNLVVHKAVC
jgi:hypothetical protein